MDRRWATLRSLNILFGKYRSGIFTLCALGLIGGFLEGVGVGALVPLLSHIVYGSVDVPGAVPRAIVAVFSGLGLGIKLRYLLTFIAALFIVKAVLLYLFEYIKIRTISDYEKNIRIKLYDRFLTATWPYLLKQKIGHLENMLMSDIGASVKLLTNVINAILTVTSLFMYVVVAISISYFITAISLVVGGVMMFSFKPLLRKVNIHAIERVALLKNIAHQINENVGGLKAIKAAAVEREMLGAVSGLFCKFQDIAVKQAMFKSLTSVFVQPVSVVFIMAAFSASFLQPGFNLAVFIAVIYLVQKIFVYVDRMIAIAYEVNNGIPHAEKVIVVQEELGEHRESAGGECPFKFERELEFKDIVFGYDDYKLVLDGVSFSVRRGEMVGIIGLSGAGKTTLADILLRLFKPRSGAILIDGANANDIGIDVWRRNIGYVSQDIFLKNDTVANNIKFYDERVSDADVLAAARAANIFDFIETLPAKFETMVGERGVALSAGQRQRVILARALARKPKILVLDEATSALDSDSETAIKRSIDALRGRISIIAIAHRLSTIRNADNLIVLDSGKIAEMGSPQFLLADPRSYFSRMYHANQ